MTVSRVLPLAATAAVSLRGFLVEKSVFVSFVLVLASLIFGMLLGEASLGHEGRLEADLTWVAAEVLGWFLAISHGAALAGRKGVLGSFALARPVPAGLLLGGRFLGIAAGLSVYATAITVVLLAWLSGWRGEEAAAVAGTGWLLALRLLVVLAIATFFLALARPAVAAPLAAAFGIAGWLGGSLSPAVIPFPLGPVSVLARFILPDLPGLAAPLAGLPGRFVELPGALFSPTLYAVLYAAAMMLAALVAFPSGIRRPRAGVA